MRLIAQRLGVSVRTVHYDLARAVEKLRGNPEAFSLILATIHGVADTERSTSDCGSVECDQRFIALYGDARKEAL
jgi:hypothetical protein